MPTIDATPEEPVELEIDPDKVCFIILKAREFDAKVAPDFLDGGSNPSDDEERVILEDYRDDATLQELRAAIDGLNEDEVIDLIGLAWVGRGDFTRAEWTEARELATERHRPHSADYLVGIPTLGDFLEEGLDELGYNVADYANGQLL